MDGLNIPVSDYEMDCLFNGVDPRDTSMESTVNLSSASEVTTALLDWMNHIFGIATYSHPDTQGPTVPTSGDGNGPTDAQPNVPNTED